MLRKINATAFTLLLLVVFTNNVLCQTASKLQIIIPASSGFSDQQMQKLYRLGASDIQWINGSGYTLLIPESNYNTFVEQYQAIQYSSSRKIDTRLQSISASSSSKTAEVLVTLHSSDYKKNFAEQLSLLLPSAAITQRATIADNTLAVNISLSELATLAKIAFVAHICPLPVSDVNLNNIGQAQMNTAALAAPQGIGGQNLNGQGITIGVGDDADLQTHIDFAGRLYNFNAAPLNTHGSIVTGQAAGAGVVLPRYRGVLPEATIISSLFSNIQSYTPKYFTDYHMTITNNSYGTTLFDCGNHGIYDAISKAVDKQALDLPLVTHVFAGGNDGQVLCAGRPLGMYSIFGQYQMAKNILVVGNVQRNDTIFKFSSKGPTLYDKRLRPDVVALGVSVTSCSINDGYTAGWGSSMSSPFVAGVVGLVQQRYKQIHNKDIRSDLAKALIMNGATDIGTKGPDFSTGYGRVNAGRSIAMLSAGNYRIDSVAQGDSIQIDFTINNSNVIWKSMLYYHDVPAEPNVYPSLVNDLDLTLKSPSGKLYKPYILDGTDTITIFNEATTGTDTLNNAEQIEVPYPELGLWSFVVKGKKVVNGRQHFVFVTDTVRAGLHLNYPFGGHHLVSSASVQEPIMWDIYDTIKYPVNIQYSTNGGNTWITLAANVDSTVRQYFFNPPACDSNGLRVRISANNGQVVTSGKSSCMQQPVLTIGGTNEQCPGYCRFSWTSVPNATGYYIYQRINNVMQLIDSTTTALNYIAKNLGTTQKHYFAVRARKYNTLSEQSTAKSYIASGGSCTLNFYNFDLQAKSVSSPTVGRDLTSTSFTSQDSIKITFANVDNVACDSFTFSYQLDNNPWQTLGPYYGLAANTSRVLSIGNANLNTVGTHSVTACINNIAKVDPNKNNDTIRFTVRQLENLPLSLSGQGYEDGFESITDTAISSTIGINGNDRWDVSASTNTGRVRTYIMKDFAATGLRAATLESSVYNASGNTTNLIGTFNLINHNADSSDLRCKFKYKHHGQDTSGGNDNAIYIRGNDTANWIKVFDLLQEQASEKGVYKNIIDVPLSKLMRTNNQQYSTSTQIKITQSGKFKTGDDYTLSGYTFDDFGLFRVYKDLALRSISAPKTISCNLSSATPITIKIFNADLNAATNVSAAYRVNNGTWITETIPYIPGDSLYTYTFNTKYNFSQPGIYNISAYVFLNADSYRINDTISTFRLNSFPTISTYPYIETFENGNGNFIASGINSSWDYGTPNTPLVPKAASGSKVWKTNLTGKYNDNEYSYLISPCFDISNISKPWLSWHMQYDVEDCYTTLCDAAWLEFSSDGIQWIKINPDSITAPLSYLQYYNDSTFKLWKGKQAKWRSYGVPIPKNIGNTIQFRFVLNSDAGVTFDGLAIDDIHVYNEALPVVQNQTISNVSLQNLNSTQFTAINALGGQFAAINPNSNNNLTSIKASTFHNKGNLITVNGKYFLDRNYVLQPSIINFTKPVLVRLYFSADDVDRILTDTVCATCSKPQSIFELGVLKFSTVEKQLEDSTLGNNTVGAYTNYVADSVFKIPCKDGYLVEIPVTTFSEFWLHFGADTSTENTSVPEISLEAYNHAALQARLEWQLPKEFNMHHFDVQRADGNKPLAGSFVQVATIPSKGNGINQQYQHIDNVPSTNAVYMYRIKAVSNSGDIYYSAQRPVVFGVNQPWQIYPNPITNNNAFFEFQLPRNSKAGIRIYDLSGRLMSEQNFVATGYVEKVNIANSLARGVYMLKVFTDDRIETFKVIKQ